MKQTQLGTWKSLWIGVIAILLLKTVGVWIGMPIFAVILWLAYRKK